MKQLTNKQIEYVVDTLVVNLESSVDGYYNYGETEEDKKGYLEEMVEIVDIIESLVDYTPKTQNAREGFELVKQFRK